MHFSFLRPIHKDAWIFVEYNPDDLVKKFGLLGTWDLFTTCG